jgi:hypothetical protein
MTEQDWKIVLQVFQASRSRRGDKGQDDRRFRSPALFRGSQRGASPCLGGRRKRGQTVRLSVAHAVDFFPIILYKGRARIEQSVVKLKRFKVDANPTKSEPAALLGGDSKVVLRGRRRQRFPSVRSLGI